jgi:hypothetical protein
MWHVVERLCMVMRISPAIEMLSLELCPLSVFSATRGGTDYLESLVKEIHRKPHVSRFQ